jgi:hypothetical protein
MAAEDNPDTGKSRVTPRQMALALFEDMFDLGMPISEANREIGYQRNNFFTQIVNMGLPARRFLDAAYFIVAQEQEARDQYDVELTRIRRSTGTPMNTTCGFQSNCWGWWGSTEGAFDSTSILG